METLPMFPLGLVAFPGSVVPLRLFEPRYLKLHEDLVSGNGEFGIVLIERGVAEAHGGEHFSIGTVVRTVASAPMEDGSVMLIATGTERMRVERWLDDDPYPRAVVERLPTPKSDDMVAEVMADCSMLLTRVLALASELGADVGVDAPEIDREPVGAMYDIAHLAPIQELDQQRILEAEDALDGARTLRDELTNVIDRLTIQLGEG
ncbi:LON peptidase substrate-binding domain-containing protein [Actinomycetota bacterium]|jgi:Lon protease-like protein